MSLPHAKSTALFQLLITLFLSSFVINERLKEALCPSPWVTSSRNCFGESPGSTADKPFFFKLIHLKKEKKEVEKVNEQERC